MKIVLPDGIIGVGVSGGADSMVLLDLVARSGARFFAVNIEHGIRGEESLRDSRFVAEYCRSRAIPLVSFDVDAVAERVRAKESLELSARRLRYRAFDSLLSSKKADYIALAHHSNDNAETVLMRILRGTGIRGLRGIADRDGYIHPLIKYTRAQIEEYAALHGIPYVIDGTNSGSDYIRNFLRNEVFTVLAKRFDNAERGFERLSENAAEVDDYLRTQTLEINEDSGAFSLNISALDAAHPLIKKISIMELLCRMGVPQDIESRHLDYIIGLCRKRNNARINLPHNVIAFKEYDKLSFRRDESQESFCRGFDIQNVYCFGGSCYRFEPSDKLHKGISFDAERVPKDAVIRTRRDGDSFKRCGGRTKNLGDYLTDKKLPIAERDKLLVIAAGSEVYAVCGMEVSDKVKITQSTKKIINIIKE